MSVYMLHPSPLCPSHWLAWGVSCREKTGCKARRVSEPAASLYPITLTWIQYSQMVSSLNVSASHQRASRHEEHVCISSKHNGTFVQKHHEQSSRSIWTTFDRQVYFWHVRHIRDRKSEQVCSTWRFEKSFHRNRRPEKKDKKTSHSVVGLPVLYLCLFVMKGSFWCESGRDRLGWLSCHKGCSQWEQTWFHG